MSDTMPSPEDQERAKWAHLQAQITLAQRQGRWGIPKAVAMILLAAAAISAAGGLAGRFWPAPPLTITVHFDQPFPGARK
jgi:hypothetical protein